MVQIARVTINKQAMLEFMTGTKPGTPGGEVARFAKEVAQRAETNAPRGETGQLAASFRVTQSRTARGRYSSGRRVQNDQPYSQAVEQGTGPAHTDFMGNSDSQPQYFPGRGTRGGVFANYAKFRGYQVIVLKDKIHEKGTKPAHFLRDAYQDAKLHFPKLFRNGRI